MDTSLFKPLVLCKDKIEDRLKQLTIAFDSLLNE